MIAEETAEIKQLLTQEIAAINAIPVNQNIPDAVSAIHKFVHQNGGKVVFSGMGKAGQIGQNIATTLCSTGTPAIFLHPSEAQHGDLGILQKNDVLFLVSNSGKTLEIIQLIHLAKTLFPDIFIISLTGFPENEIGKHSNITLSTGEPKEICPLGLTPTTSTTVMIVLGDLLVVLLMKKINFKKEDYSKRHHSGYLGTKSREND